MGIIFHFIMVIILTNLLRIYILDILLNMKSYYKHVGNTPGKSLSLSVITIYLLYLIIRSANQNFIRQLWRHADVFREHYMRVRTSLDVQQYVALPFDGHPELIKSIVALRGHGCRVAWQNGEIREYIYIYCKMMA